MLKFVWNNYCGDPLKNGMSLWTTGFRYTYWLGFFQKEIVCLGTEGHIARWYLKIFENLCIGDKSGMTTRCRCLSNACPVGCNSCPSDKNIRDKVLENLIDRRYSGRVIFYFFPSSSRLWQSYFYARSICSFLRTILLFGNE